MKRRNDNILIITASFLGSILLFFIGIKYRKHPEVYYDQPMGTVRNAKNNYKNIIIDKSKYHYDSAYENYCEQ